MFAAHANASKPMAQLEAMRAHLDDAVGFALEKTGALAVGLAKQTTLFNDKTGKLRSSIAATDASRTVIRVQAKTAYARFVESGTAAHDIVASAGKLLRFVVGGAVFYRRRVHHPGTKPRPFMANTAREMAPVFSREVVDALNRMLASKSRG